MIKISSSYDFISQGIILIDLNIYLCKHFYTKKERVGRRKGRSKKMTSFYNELNN
jgi:hypothetical protein